MNQPKLLRTCILTDVTVPAALVSGFPGEMLDAPAQDGLIRTTIGWENGRFCPIAELEGMPRLDASGMAALPLLAESHVHLDKTRTIGKTGFADGSLMGAIHLVSKHMETCGFDDFLARMTTAAEEACARGVRALRTHIDTFKLPNDVPAWRAAQDLRSEIAPRMTLQFVTLSGITRAQADDFDLYCKQIADTDGIMGAFVPPGAVDPALLDTFLSAAERFGLNVDFHIDEGLEVDVCNVVTLAESIKRTNYSGRVIAGHCCALAMLSEAKRDAALDLIAASGMAVVSLPQTNLFLQDRTAGCTPQLRGLTLIHELRARGVPVAIGTDNVGDAFFPFGDYDLLNLFGNSIASGHLNDNLGEWLRAITDVPARAMGITDTGRIEPGQNADLMLLPAQDWISILDTKFDQRQIIRGGETLANEPIQLLQPSLCRATL